MKTFEDFEIDLMGKTGEEIRVLCPQCSPNRRKNKIKDLAVNTSLGTWFCHHCGWSGGLGGKQKMYAKPEYKAELKLPESVTGWFKTRGISVATLELMKVGYGPIWMPATGKEENAIQFPFYKNGVVVNIKYRDGRKNFRQAKSAEKCFYGFDRMTHSNPYLIITEGEIDALSLIECGFNDVVSMPDGAPSANAKNYNTKFDFLRTAEKKLKGYKKIILAVDSDAPGKRAEEELCRRLGAERCYRVAYPSKCKDANDTLIKCGRQAVKDLINNAKPMPVSGLFVASDFKGRVETLYDDGVEKGALTGWIGLDEYYTCRPGEMTIVTGIPGSGKSNWLDCLMLNLIDRAGWKFAVYSPENWPIERHIQTLSEKLTGQPFAKGFSNKYPRLDREAIADIVDYLDENVFFIQPDEEKEDPNVDSILRLTKVALFRYGIRGLIIDPWNEISHDYGKLTETQYISKELGRLRRFCRLNGIHIFIVAHPQKLQKGADGKYAPPTMYDISGGAHWRNKADNGICVHRHYSEGYKDQTDIIIQKIRFRDIGQIGIHSLRFEYATGKYIDDCREQND